MELLDTGEYLDNAVDIFGAGVVTQRKADKWWVIHDMSEVVVSTEITSADRDMFISESLTD